MLGRNRTCALNLLLDLHYLNMYYVLSRWRVNDSGWIRYFYTSVGEDRPNYTQLIHSTQATSYHTDII